MKSLMQRVTRHFTNKTLAIAFLPMLMWGSCGGGGPTGTLVHQWNLKTVSQNQCIGWRWTGGNTPYVVESKWLVVCGPNSTHAYNPGECVKGTENYVSSQSPSSFPC